ncbi:hypothetical protein JHN59_34365 [Streptomyces sp. MBT49]|uniref:DUF6082 family protein n=1 Tax=Streptomyces TaxID=1883 RepID=UPI0019093E8D|nr:DUF6082 family protein [Streptomyces sp. MBT49]MBK3629806.1 hypothetical protein [Streptomyces sp. MBT49]
MSPHKREVLVLAATTAAACIGSLGITLALTCLPFIQSTEIGNAGQAYGAAAAATSVIVLVYIARTFQQQSVEARMHRAVLEAQTAELCLQREMTESQHKTVQRSAEAAVRARHIKLLEMAINDPLLMDCWSGYGPNISDDRRKQYLYCNLIVSHQCMCYELGYYTDEEVISSLRGIFHNEVMRNFWQATQVARDQIAQHGGSMRKFYDLAELAYSHQMNHYSGHQ